MEKLDVIKEAYGDTYESLHQFIDFNGFIRFDDADYSIHFKYEDLEHYSPFGERKWRPKNLSGIENNNGWTKINSVDDLPNQQGFYLFLKHTLFSSISSTPERAYYSPGLFDKPTSEYYSHWRNEILLPNPLY